MLCVCGVYVVRMWCVCGAHVVHMWCECGAYVTPCLPAFSRVIAGKRSAMSERNSGSSSSTSLERFISRSTRITIRGYSLVQDMYIILNVQCIVMFVMYTFTKEHLLKHDVFQIPKQI